MADADVGRRLLEYLRAQLGEPALEFSEAPTAVSGGFDTQIFAFRLRHAPTAYAGPLILRLFGAGNPPARALREAVTQNTVAELGYPAPRALLATADPALLGGAFLVMERLPGRILGDAGLFRIRQLLLETQLRLHALDAEALLRALEREERAAIASGGPALGREMMTLGGHLARLERRIADGGLDGLAASMTWLLERRPIEPARLAICHGDLHPWNILVSGDVVTGVIDWANTIVADAAYDVASTRTILSSAPVELLPIPAAGRPVVRGLRHVMVWNYVRGYRRRRPLDRRAFAYYEALSCMRQLVRTAENRSRAGANQLNPLDASSFGDVLAARFARITGILPGLPPAPAIPPP